MNQNDNEISPHTCQDGFYQKEITIAGKDVEKPIGGNAIGGAIMGNSMTVSQKTKNCTTI